MINPNSIIIIMQSKVSSLEGIKSVGRARVAASCSVTLTQTYHYNHKKVSK